MDKDAKVAMIEDTMAIGYIDEVEKIKALAPLTDADIARATGSSAGTVAAWRAHRQVPRGPRARRLVELSALVERLSGVIQRDYIPVWLNKPVPRLDHRAPADVLAAGGYEQVSGAIGELEYPTFT
jgi:uncharacterized protein (DUF2384 family)